MLRVFAGLLACGLVPGAAAAQTYWDYKDWTVQIEDVDTGEDIRRTCTASTGGDGLPGLHLQVFNGDAGPPDFYPAPTLVERAPRGYSTQIKSSDLITFLFDDVLGADVDLETGFEDDTYPYAHARPFARDVLWFLQTMRAEHSLTVWRTSSQGTAREEVYTASLSGFTAAYLKMMESCGFDPGAVMN